MKIIIIKKNYKKKKNNKKNKKIYKLNILTTIKEFDDFNKYLIQKKITSF